MTGKGSEQVALQVEPDRKPDMLAEAVVREVEYQLRPLAERIAKLERAIAELHDQANRMP
jgi:hypothetical protein